MALSRDNIVYTHVYMEHVLRIQLVFIFISLSFSLYDISILSSNIFQIVSQKYCLFLLFERKACCFIGVKIFRKQIYIYR